MNRAPFEDLHNSLLASQDLAFFEEIQKKASRNQTREYYDDLEVRQTWTEVFEDSKLMLLTDPFLHPTYHRSYLACSELFPRLFVVYGQGKQV